MNKKNIKLLIISGAALGLLGFMILAATDARVGKTYTNPVLVETVIISREKPDNFNGVLGIGDPAVLFHKGKYYLYPTGDNRGYDVYISADLVNWQKGPRVFQSNEPGTWAPDVFYNATDGQFYLYYTVNGRIGVAVADRPDGLFKDHGSLIDNAIDAHMFVDEDDQYYRGISRLQDPCATHGFPAAVKRRPCPYYPGIRCLGKKDRSAHRSALDAETQRLLLSAVFSRRCR